MIRKTPTHYLLIVTDNFLSRNFEPLTDILTVEVAFRP
jgi:hypothetical protein